MRILNAPEFWIALTIVLMVAFTCLGEWLRRGK